MCPTSFAIEQNVGKFMDPRPVEAAVFEGRNEVARKRERALRGPRTARGEVGQAGVHEIEVDVVVHYDPPEDQKAYLHRSGRTARAGAKGVAVTLMLYNQENIVRTVLRRLSLSNSIIEVFSNDPRLADLRSFDPDETSVPA